jgi:DNA-directed RNA polymerase specialized sigma24 family protein
MPVPDSEPGRSSDRQEWFATTHWSVVLAAGEAASPQSSEALEKLCRTYWYPVYAYIRRRGYNAEDAKDLTQEFFTRVLAKNYPGQADPAKGKFRSFLLLRLNHFLADEYDRATTQKRGGGQIFISLEDQSPEDRYGLEPADELTPEKIFERRWAQTILDQAIARLQAEFVADGKVEIYEVLKAFQPGEQNALSYAEAATRRHGRRVQGAAS